MYCNPIYRLQKLILGGEAMGLWGIKENKSKVSFPSKYFIFEVLSDMGNVLLKEKDNFRSGQYKYYERDGESRGVIINY